MYISALSRRRARARGRSNAGTAAAVVAEMRHHHCGTRPETSRQGWCGGHGGWHVPFAMAAQAVWSRCASRASRDMAAGAFAASYRERTGQLPKRWVGFRSERTAREALKGQPTGGHAEQASNTARGTPEVPADLRRYRLLAGSTGPKGPIARHATGLPWCREALRPVGPKDPGVPRALIFSGATELHFGLRANPAPLKQYGRRSVG